MSSRERFQQQFGRMLDSAKSGLNAIHQQAAGAGSSYFYPSTLEVKLTADSGFVWYGSYDESSNFYESCDS